MLKSFDKWLIPYFRSVVRRPRSVSCPVHIMFAVCDHFEPLSPGGRQSHEAGLARVTRWRDEYPRIFSELRDSDGVAPQHTFFFPAEEYHADFLNPLAELTRQRLGEVEVHLHHRNDTAATLRDKLIDFRDLLRNEHGLLADQIVEAGGAAHEIHEISQKKRIAHGKHGTPRKIDAPNNLQPRRVCATDAPTHQRTNAQPSSLSLQPSPCYAFIHGNWALCNSRPDGDWCGVNEEITVLRETGCYADLTFPSVPSPTQPHMANCIYYAQEKSGRPRSHDQGIEASVRQTGERSTLNASPPNNQQPTTSNQQPTPNTLLLITGPLALNWKWRKWGVLPRIEHADLCGSNPPTPQRADLWVRQHIHVRDRPDWIFIKLHTHGCIEANTEVLLGEPMRELHRYLAQAFNNGKNYKLHYVTAREMANIVHAAEAGMEGDPGEYRDFMFSPPPAQS